MRFDLGMLVAEAVARRSLHQTFPARLLSLIKTSEKIDDNDLSNLSQVRPHGFPAPTDLKQEPGADALLSEVGVAHGNGPALGAAPSKTIIRNVTFYKTLGKTRRAIPEPLQQDACCIENAGMQAEVECQSQWFA